MTFGLQCLEMDQERAAGNCYEPPDTSGRKPSCGLGTRPRGLTRWAKKILLLTGASGNAGREGLPEFVARRDCRDVVVHALSAGADRTWVV